MGQWRGLPETLHTVSAACLPAWCSPAPSLRPSLRPSFPAPWGCGCRFPPAHLPGASPAGALTCWGHSGARAVPPRESKSWEGSGTCFPSKWRHVVSPVTSAQGKIKSGEAWGRSRARKHHVPLVPCTGHRGSGLSFPAGVNGPVQGSPGGGKAHLLGCWGLSEAGRRLRGWDVPALPLPSLPLSSPRPSGRFTSAAAA